MNLNKDLFFMEEALLLARDAEKIDEVPIGAVLVDQNEKIIARGKNFREIQKSPLGHAEIDVINKAAAYLSSWRLNDCTLYVTLEPCLMCLSAMVQARITRCVFGAFDPKGGAISMGYHLHTDQRLNHRFSVTGGILQMECSALLQDFFKAKRSTKI
jgi:tRNA(adenine34) deaminase